MCACACVRACVRARVCLGWRETLQARLLSLQIRHVFHTSKKKKEKKSCVFQEGEPHKCLSSYLFIYFSVKLISHAFI